MRHRHPRRVRSRHQTRPGHWHVRARIERLPEVAGEGRVDVGNLYRLLRALEAEALVTSEWSAELPGPAKRTYQLTPEGHRLLDRWAEALRQAQRDVQAFLDRYD